MTAKTRALDVLARAGVEHQVHEYELAAEGGTYGEAVAATLDVAPERLFKTLVAVVDGEPHVAIVPTAGRLDLKALARAAGGKRAALADPTDAERWTGYVTGGISPLGQKRRLRAFVDASAEDHTTIYVSGGLRGLQVELAPAALVDLLQAALSPGLSR